MPRQQLAQGSIGRKIAPQTGTAQPPRQVIGKQDLDAGLAAKGLEHRGQIGWCNVEVRRCMDDGRTSRRRANGAPKRQRNGQQHARTATGATAQPRGWGLGTAHRLVV